MKPLLIIGMCLCAGVCMAQNSGSVNTHVKVHAGEAALEALLTEEQKEKVVHLTVTGTLQDEDYAFLRGGLLGQLDTLDLRDAEIDTLPAHAFEDLYCYKKESVRVILPVGLKHVRDKAFCSNTHSCVFELTGKYPTLGEDIFTKDFIYAEPRMEVSSDNKYCTMVEGAIYSSDQTILHYPNYDWREPVYGGKIVEGTKVISANAYENRAWEYQWIFTIPASVDSIGDRAFASFQIATPDMPVDFRYFRMVCESSTPPRLGRDVFYTMENPYWGLFYVNEATLYVPDGSVGAYKTTEGWSQFKKIKGISELKPISVALVAHDPALSVKDVGGCYMLNSSIVMEQVELYSISGQLLHSMPVHARQGEINKSLITSPYVIASIGFADGTTQTVKLIP